MGDPIGDCEDCGCPLFAGDTGFSYNDGPMFCAEHAPTWEQCDDRDAFSDEGYASFSADRDAHVTRGGSLKDRVTWTL